MVAQTLAQGADIPEERHAEKITPARWHTRGF